LNIDIFSIFCKVSL